MLLKQTLESKDENGEEKNQETAKLLDSSPICDVIWVRTCTCTYN